MALFTRRLLQRILDENAAFLRTDQLSTICGLLNRVHDNYLAVEWEQVLLNTISKLGSVSYEIKSSGPTSPDVLFCSPDLSIEFLAEITTASDSGLHEQNPIDYLIDELARRVQKAGLPFAGFDVQCDALTNAPHSGSPKKARLKLPPRRDFEFRIFHSDFKRFLRSIREKSDTAHKFDAVGPDVGVHIAYDPAKRGGNSAGYLAYTSANVKDNNPVYNALKAKGDHS